MIRNTQANYVCNARTCRPNVARPPARLYEWINQPNGIHYTPTQPYRDATNDVIELTL